MILTIHFRTNFLDFNSYSWILHWMKRNIKKYISPNDNFIRNGITEITSLNSDNLLSLQDSDNPPQPPPLREEEVEGGYQCPILGGS